MIPRALLACGACLVVLGCTQAAQTSSTNESRMDADTVSRPADSLMIGGSGAAPITAEPLAAEPSSQMPSAALSDLSASRNVDTTISARPRPLPAETVRAKKPD